MYVLCISSNTSINVYIYIFFVAFSIMLYCANAKKEVESLFPNAEHPMNHLIHLLISFSITIIVS